MRANSHEYFFNHVAYEARGKVKTKYIYNNIKIKKKMKTYLGYGSRANVIKSLV